VNKITLDELQIKQADVDGSLLVDAKDALLILQHVVGKLPVFPIEQ